MAADVNALIEAAKTAAARSEAAKAAAKAAAATIAASRPVPPVFPAAGAPVSGTPAGGVR
jgi:hypothetical protein